MAIRSILLNVTDVARSVDFYRRFLGVEVREQDDDGALLDAVVADLRLVRVPAGAASTWVADDLQAGFRHIGFKVSDLDARVEALHAAGVPFQLEPIHAEGEVRITFFYDPDGTLVELVEGPLRYHEVIDRGLVESDWGLGDPDRPRFDHVGETVADLDVTREYYAGLGFALMSGIHQPSDPRGFEIAYLRGGDTSLEVFTFATAVERRAPQLDAPGFLAVEFAAPLPAAATPVGTATGIRLAADPDGLVQTGPLA